MKKGFTLTELLAVIAILSILVLLAVPNIIKIYNDSTKSAMEVQENQILDASNLYVTDYCTRRINSTYVCPSSYTTGTTIKYICLNDITSKGYIENIKYKASNCSGVIVYDSDGKNGKTYLYCGAGPNYTYKTEGAPNTSEFNKCSF